MSGNHQRVGVATAAETEKAAVGAKLRVHVKGQWEPDGDLVTLGVYPVTFNEHGRPDDVIVRLRARAVIVRLDFLMGARLFSFRPRSPIGVQKGNPVRLAIGELRLVDKFGRTVLG